MEINKGVYVEQETQGDFKEIVSSIRSEDLGMALDAVSRNLYSNPIGSFVRELVSNAVDANRQNNSAELVKVNIYKEGNTWYFQVKDEGQGMTYEHFTNVYMRWFNSDKRENNEDIGGWGIGSKSPLSYKETYELTTIADGIEYEYIIIRQSPAPTATLLSQKSTNKKSGTTIRVEIDYDDLWKLSDECEKQLTYFNNVYVVNEFAWYDNNFKIIEADLFKVRNSNFPFGNQMHIALGQVAYPINWNTIGVNQINIPIALKFNIGELPVTLSREEINYSDETVKSLIKQKIEIVYADLFNRFSEQYKTRDLFEYLSFFTEDEKQLKLTDNFSIPFRIRDNGRLRPTFIANDKEYKIAKDNIDIVFSIFNVSEIKNTVISHNAFVNHKGFLLGTSKYLYREEDFNHWSNLYYTNGVLLNKRKITRNILRNIASAIGLTFEKTTKSSIKSTIKDGGLLETYKFINYLNNEFKRKLQQYDIVPQTFIDAKKEEQKLLEEERKGNITTYNLRNEKTNIKLEKLLDDYKYVFYIDKNEDREKIAHYQALFDSIPKYFKDKYKFIIITPTNIKKIKKFKDTIKEVSLVWRIANLFGFYNRLKYSSIIYSFGLNSYNLGKVSSYYEKQFLKIKQFNLPSIINSYVVKKGKEKEDSTMEYFSATINTDLYYYFKNYIDKIEKNRNVLIEQLIEEFQKVATPLNILCSLDTSNPTDKIQIRRVIKENKLTKLNNKYYGICKTN